MAIIRIIVMINDDFSNFFINDVSKKCKKLSYIKYLI